MKKFIKGSIETVVEDNDKRIPEYKANGWKEVPLAATPDTAKTALNQALADVEASEQPADTKNKGKGNKRNGKTADTETKVNAAVEASSAAAVESGEVDDGLEKKED